MEDKNCTINIKSLPEIFLKANFLGNGKSYYLKNDIKLYYKKLECALNDIKEGKHTDYLFFSFISLSSATLEYSLNLMYSIYCFFNFNFPQCKTYLEVYKNLRFKNKLFILPHVLSEGKVGLNDENQNVKTLYELISIRNKVLHNSEDAQEFVFPNIQASIIDNKLFVPIENATIDFEISTKENIMEALNEELCIRIGNAMLTFYKMLFIPYIEKGVLDNNDLLRNK